MTGRTPNFWIVGAAKEGKFDHYEDFIERGHWKLFWADKVPTQLTKRQLNQVETTKQIQRGDRIAIKKKRGGRDDGGEILIRAIGIVENVSRSENKVLVKWLRTGLDQVVVGTGWSSSVHGPFKADDARVRDAFSAVDDFNGKSDPHGALPQDLKAVIADTTVRETTKEALIDARVGQGKFRSDVLELWSNRCAVTGSCTLEVIRASHIKPWRDSSNEERLDASNGLPLVANLDALFDAGFISFDESGGIIISSALVPSERKYFGISRSKLAKKPAGRTAMFLQFHRTNVFRDQ